MPCHTDIPVFAFVHPLARHAWIALSKAFERIMQISISRSPQGQGKRSGRQTSSGAKCPAGNPRFQNWAASPPPPTPHIKTNVSRVLQIHAAYLQAYALWNPEKSRLPQTIYKHRALVHSLTGKLPNGNLCIFPAKIFWCNFDTKMMGIWCYFDGILMHPCYKLNVTRTKGRNGFISVTCTSYRMEAAIKWTRKK